VREERTPEETAIWDGMLKLVDSLPDGRGGASRGPGEFRRGYGDSIETGPFERFSASTEFKQFNARGDGVDDVYDIEVTVTKRQDSNEAYWRQQLADRAGAIVINGVHYRIGKGMGGGFGGRRFDIRMLGNGHVVETRNLWFQGPIPPKWRERFPDNAEFVNPDQEPFKR
jgi:hypothetical protein